MNRVKAVSNGAADDTKPFITLGKEITSDTEDEEEVFDISKVK